QSLSEELFSFSFAAIQYVKKSRDFDAFSATAAFNSSAIPEPATLAIFGIGAAMMFRLRKRA
ncbi:MAG: PEP-CTERM sorting domain-containing protein, partial [Phycisphaerae bacterium]|nr:PEP-CTERM sorting domain-containing protein [Phycisphaerae bacterium]